MACRAVFEQWLEADGSLARESVGLSKAAHASYLNAGGSGQVGWAGIAREPVRITARASMSLTRSSVFFRTAPSVGRVLLA